MSADDEGGRIRLQKVLADRGVASRRKAEDLIRAGRVRVDGARQQLVHPEAGEQHVHRDHRGALLADAAQVLGPNLLVIRGRVGALERGRANVVDMVGRIADVYPVGRLDADSEGLVLLTNDGEWAERVLHPRYEVEREYAVAVRRPLDEAAVAAIGHGLELDEGVVRLARPVRRQSAAETRRLAEIVDPPLDPELTWYRAVLRQGWKRQIRRMFAAVGVPVVRLVRVRIGAARLDGLASGRIRRLRHEEVARLAGGQEPARGRKRPGRRGGPGSGARRA